MKKPKLLLLLLQLILSLSAHAKSHGNPANELVETINKNRTLHRLSNLTTSPGLGCLALQYIHSCKENCSNNTMHCKWNETDFIEIFAPNCGIELPTFGTISSHIIACHSKYLKPFQAFTQVLVTNAATYSLVSNKSLKDVGVGIIRDHKGHSFWSMLFSTDKVNSTFLLEGHGQGIKQRRGGCFSGSTSSHSSSCTSDAQMHQSRSSLNHVYATICIYVLQYLLS